MHHRGAARAAPSGWSAGRAAKAGPGAAPTSSQTLVAASLAAILPRAELSRHRLMFIAQAFAGHAEDHWINVVTSRAGGAFAEVSLLAATPRGHALHAVPTRPETTSSLRAFTASRYASPSRGRRASTSPGHRSAPRLKAAKRRRRRAPRHERPKNRRARLRYARGPSYVTRPYPRSSGRRASRATSWACSRSSPLSGATRPSTATRSRRVARHAARPGALAPVVLSRLSRAQAGKAPAA